MPDEDHSQVVFANIARDLASQPSEQAVLDRVVDLTVQLIDGWDDAGILLVHRKQEAETSAASSKRVHESDQAQTRLEEGPCFDAAMGQSPWHNRVYRSNDLSAETSRWLLYGPEARRLGITSMIGFQLYHDDETFGALNVYGERKSAFDDVAETRGWVLASHAAVALTSARTSEQLRTAMQTRQEIGQAVGRVMERYGIPAETAFTVLQRASQDHNVKLHSVAETVVRTGEIPGAQ